jgi:hypothetical protein
MNALANKEGDPVVDATTGRPQPVSWAVMILPEIDRATLYDEWRRVPEPNESKPSATKHQIYIELLNCPSDQKPDRLRPWISYVANTGMPDLPAAIVDEQDPTRSLPRDWPDNGMFFDNFTDHSLVQEDEKRRRMMVRMTEAGVVDDKYKTILLTENVDATEYVFDAATQSADGWRAVEIQTGCIWKPGPLDTSKTLPAMTPPTRALQMNVDTGKGTGTSYDYCRPSSHHPQMVNVAFVATNVAALQEKISYFVYAKLMASDDANVAKLGMRYNRSDPTSDTIGAAFRTYELTDVDINP